MPNVGLLVSNPTVTYGNYNLGPTGWRLSFKACLGNSLLQHVDLTTDEEDMDKLDGSLGFVAEEAGPGYMGYEKGCLSYWEGSHDILDPRPPSYIAELRLPAVDLARIMKTLADGLELRSINIDVPGMAYGWEPDGSGKKWDNKEKRCLEIEGFRLFFGQPETDELIPYEPQPPEPSVDTDMKSLVAIRELQQTNRYILYALLVLILVLISWKGWFFSTK